MSSAQETREEVLTSARGLALQAPAIKNNSYLQQFTVVELILTCNVLLSYSTNLIY